MADLMNIIREMIARDEGITVEEVKRREEEHQKYLESEEYKAKLAKEAEENRKREEREYRNQLTTYYPTNEKIKLTKTNLNKIVQWTSSRYNPMRKADVVTDIYKRAKAKEDCVKVYGAGRYSWKSDGGGFDHMLVIYQGVVKLICFVGRPAQKVYEFI